MRTVMSLAIVITLSLSVRLASAAPAAAPGDEPSVERLRAEAERARAEAERARAEAERARAELDRAEASATVRETVELPDPGAHRHDGFFLRMAGGGGYAGFRSAGELSASEGTGDRARSGPGAVGLLSLGGAVSEALLVHADFWGDAGTFQLSGDRHVDIGTATMGVGVTHYWMPWNVYLTGSVGFATTAWHLRDGWSHEGEEDYDGATGVGTYVMVGKEWWVSDNWGLGIALRGEYAYTQNDDVRFHHGGVQALFTATFN